MNEYNLTYEKIKREDVGFLLQCYKEDYGKIKITDYSEMFRGFNKAKLNEENKNKIDVLLFEEVIDDAGEYYIFDFQIGKVIISASDDFVQEDDIVGEADELIKEEIGNLFDLYDVYTWSVEKKKEYDINVMDDGYANWSINIKFSNNEVYVLSGNGINDEYAPEDLDLFVEDLKALATSSATENS